MKRRRSPSILLYSLGLALAFSLVFNGLLLHERSLQRSSHGYEVSGASFPIGYVTWQHQFTECQRANQQKDSLIWQLEHAANAPPGRAITLQRIHFN